MFWFSFHDAQQGLLTKSIFPGSLASLLHAHFEAAHIEYSALTSQHLEDNAACSTRLQTQVHELDLAQPAQATIGATLIDLGGAQVQALYGDAEGAGGRGVA